MRRYAATELMMRGRFRSTGRGGSSGCSPSRTPASSATGTTARRKYSRADHICSSVTSPGATRAGLRSASARLNPLTSAPPRSTMALSVRPQLSSAIQL